MGAEDDMWKEIGPSVTEFADAIKDMKANVERLVEFYREHVERPTCGPSISNNQQLAGEVPMEQDHEPEKPVLSPLAVAKLQLAIVLAMNTCYWTYLVTEGVDPRKHKIASELERIKLFVGRAKAIEDSLINRGQPDGMGLKRAKFNVQETW